MAFKLGNYEITVKDESGNEAEALPDGLPVTDFEGNTVTLDEVKKGYLRQSDYTRKTQEVAAVRQLMQDLGLPDHVKAAETMRHILVKQKELEDLGVLDTRDGSINHQVLAGNQADHQDNNDLDINQPDTNANLRAQQQILNRLEGVERDMGGFMSLWTRKEIRERFSHFDDEMLDWVYSQHSANPQYSPMQYAEAMENKLKDRDQAAIDRHEEVKKKEREDSLTRKPGEPSTDMFTEDVVFTLSPERHEGKTKVTPHEAATRFLEGALSSEE